MLARISHSGPAQDASPQLRRSVVFASLLMASALVCAQTGPKPVLSPSADPGPGQSTPPAPSSSASLSAAATTDLSTYVIGADDVLQITVWKEPTLSGSFPVRPDGMISLVLVGDLKASGTTPMQLGKDITAHLEKYVQNPIVTVVVSAVNSQRIFLVGEVGHIGPIQLVPGMTPLQAIATGGGLTPYANGKHIYILRGPQGKQVKIPFNYKLALKGDNQQNITLLPGDTIVVP